MPDQAAPSEGQEFADDVAFDEYLGISPPCSMMRGDDTYCDVIDGVTHGTMMPDPPITRVDSDNHKMKKKLDESKEGGDSSCASVPSILPEQAERGTVPVLDNQERVMVQVAAPGEGLEFINHAAFDKYLGLPSPCSNGTYYDVMDGVTHTVYDYLFPLAMMSDPPITWDDSNDHKMERKLDETEGGDSCAGVSSILPDQAERDIVPLPNEAAPGKGLEFVDHAAFNQCLDLPPHPGVMSADNTCDDVTDRVTHGVYDDFVPPAMMLAAPKISWEDSDDYRVKRKLDGTEEGGNFLAMKKPRKIWNGTSLHERFVEVVNQLGGADNAVPTKILELMNQPELTRENVASHLQKYRISLKRESTQQEKVKSHLPRFPESYFSRGVPRPSLQDSTNLSYVPTMWQQPMNIRKGSMMREPSTYMEPRQFIAMPGFSFPHEPISRLLDGLASRMPQQRQNIPLPDYYFRDRDMGHANMGITGNGFPAAAATVNSVDELDGILRRRASSCRAFDTATGGDGVEEYPYESAQPLNMIEDNTQPESLPRRE